MDRLQFFMRGAPVRVRESGTQAATTNPSLAKYSGPWNRPQIMHLLRRALVAPTFAEVQQATAMNRDALVDQLLAPPASLPAATGWFGDLVNNPSFPWYDRRFDLNDAFAGELRRWWFAQMTNNGLSIRERLTLFWHNHFASSAVVLDDPRLIYYQNQMLRRNALGSFRDLVRAVTLDKAMLIFLDGKYNKASGVNENYARELQELFTVGIRDNDGNQNYAQDDIVQAAHALTGWDWVGFGTSGDPVSNLLTGHDPANKTLYNQTITGNADGSPELERLLDIIFSHEGTAHYVIRKLYRFFVYTDATLTPVYPIPADVEQNIISPLAQEFKASNWDISAVLRRLLTSEHFYERDIVASTVKSPADLFVSALRATRTTTLTGDAGDFFFDIVQDRAKALGQNLFFPPGVQGWQQYRAWISTSTLPQRHFNTDELLNGVNVTLTHRPAALFPDATQTTTGVAQIDVLAFAQQFPSFNDPTQLIADIAEHLLAYPPSQKLLDRLSAELVGDRGYEWKDSADAFKTTRLQAMLRYLMRSSNFQLI